MKFPDFTIDQEDEEIEYIKSLSLYEARAYFAYLREKYKDEPLLEMAYDRQEFISKCANCGAVIHNTICNIICLGDTILPEANNHWKNELLAFTKPVIIGNIEKSVKRTKIVIQDVIKPFADNYQYDRYTYLDSYVYELAMNDELRKANKPNVSQDKKKSAKYIRNIILPNIDKFVKPNIERVAKLFDAFIDACNKVNLSIFDNALDEFINTEVQINI